MYLSVGLAGFEQPGKRVAGSVLLDKVLDGGWEGRIHKVLGVGWLWATAKRLWSPIPCWAILTYVLIVLQQCARV